ncbi:prolyl-tRNA synthetase-like protein [Phyllosticta capitalensis]
MLVPSLQRISLRSAVAPSRFSPFSRLGTYHSFSTSTHLRYDRLSKFWIPTSGLTEKEKKEDIDDTTTDLVRGGFMRQAHSGVFHMLPLGQRVQAKLEKLIDKHMASIDANKVSLSSISSEELWRKTNRLQGNQLLRVRDRKGNKLLLCPTHEEEITSLVKSLLVSYKSLPLRLYQISRKYRDEMRPRQGLLRAKEFLMKDLYTFDHMEGEAMATYEQVRAAYANFFAELNIPYLVAQADSGAIGGDLSHEYHFVSPNGEDTIFTCNSCSYVANEEVATPRASQLEEPGHIQSWRGLSKDRWKYIEVFAMVDAKNNAEEAPINIHAVKKIYPDLDTAFTAVPTSSVSEHKDKKVIRILDANVARHVEAGTITLPPPAHDKEIIATHVAPPSQSLFAVMLSTPCPSCDAPAGSLTANRAIEIGHTFHLGTRYSAPLGLQTSSPPLPGESERRAVNRPVQMGCHGIGVSRLLSAAAGLLRDERGLNWPRAIAPWEVLVVPSSEKIDAADVAWAADDALGGLDVAVDDRKDRGLGWKLKDAELMGPGVIVVLGTKWQQERKAEVRCRRLDVFEHVEADRVGEVVRSILERL